MSLGADDDVARNGRCYDTALMSLGRTMTWQETAGRFLHSANLPAFLDFRLAEDTRRNLRHKRCL